MGVTTLGGTLTKTETIAILFQSYVHNLDLHSFPTRRSSNLTITLSSANALTGAVSLNTNGASGNATLTNNLATTMAGSSIGGNLVVDDAICILTQTGILTVTGSSSFSTSAAYGSFTLSQTNT